MGRREKGGEGRRREGKGRREGEGRRVGEGRREGEGSPGEGEKGGGRGELREKIQEEEDGRREERRGGGAPTLRVYFL